MSLTKSDEAINPSSVIIRLTELLNKSLDEREKLLLQLDIPKLDGLHSEIYNEITALEMSSKMPENTIRIENLISLNNQIKNHLITYVIKHSAYNLEKALFTFRIGYPISMENGIPLESLSELYWKKENDLVKDKEFKFWEDRLLSMDSSIGLLIKCQKRAKNLLEDEKQNPWHISLDKVIKKYLDGENISDEGYFISEDLGKDEFINIKDIFISSGLVNFGIEEMTLLKELKHLDIQINAKPKYDVCEAIINKYNKKYVMLEKYVSDKRKKLLEKFAY